ncbi:glutathione S-transferase family protein [Bradyrhizobium sp. LHD-71]|uniref:glutathione S-transferase family protein n=1 Tax=Bradyrhizobium sp. LHD-71 TaxID=3072141 RepID=UPI00281000F5|nr:glutathione S-transferase family protein [Bradyrhizobium sp. LHD-71]MDQ8732027.1 glutathione S-transferase family protein [Bradyrhizobium sp. LHD-71]
MTVELHGYRYSVYSWIARFALEEKGVAYRWIEIDPFADDVPESYLALHPFKRVPALIHDGFQIYETGAITRYLDEAFAGHTLQPAEPRPRARMNQVLSIIDSYLYWPLVRQVFAHRVFRSRLGWPSDATEIDKGLTAAVVGLDALERLAIGGPYLCGPELSLADIHLAPMIGYFTMADEGASLLKERRKLDDWWSLLASRKSYLTTRPQLPEGVDS